MPSSLAVLLLVLRLTESTPRISESVIVLDEFTAPMRVAAPAAVTVLDLEALSASPAATLDDTLRSVPGFSLFRRASSRVANPTTQGVTLRGLAASGASRAVVLADDIPLNDPFGGWVYWNRIPAAALSRVDVVRGAAGDLFGADAVAGSILIETDTRPELRVVAEGGTDATARLSGYGGVRTRQAQIFGAAEQFTTDGFVIVAPESRGPIDTPAASKHWSAHGALMTPQASSISGQLRGSYFAERRKNGTPFQRNSTVIRQASGRVSRPTGVGLWLARGYFVSQDYDQTFSAVPPGRRVERPTSLQHVDAQTAGAAVEWLHKPGPAAMLFTANARHVAAVFTDQQITSGGIVPLNVDARQTSVGGSGQVTYAPGPRVFLAGGLRVEYWKTRDEGGGGFGPEHVLVMPRITGVFVVAPQLTLRAAYQNADRNPTLNELYRPFSAGNTITLANPLLDPETVSSFEGAAVWTPSLELTIRGIGFWTNVDHAIVNVTLSPPGSAVIRRERQNASEIRAAGAEAEFEWRVPRGVTLTASAALTNSKFTEADLDGLWVPQVARSQVALGARGDWPRFKAGGEWRYIGRQFDDDRNEFLLEPAAVFDGRVGWLPRRGIELFAALENAFDEEMDVGRTPIRTIGLPRTFRAGLRITR